jgi:hypothetical protein
MNTKLHKLKEKIRQRRALKPDYELGSIQDTIFLSFSASQLWFKDVGKLIGLPRKENELLRNERWLEKKVNKKINFHHSEANKFTNFIYRGKSNGAIDMPYKKLKQKLIKVEYV